MDFATIAGIVLALAAILGGHIIEGGALGSILQPTAGIIVIGGTVGAVCVTFPGAVLLQTVRTVRRAVVPLKHDLGALLQTLVGLAQRARRDGLVSIESEAAAIPDDFTRRALELAIDGTEAKQLRNALEIEIQQIEHAGEMPAKVLEAAGGYSPTIGIMGAVLGLIHVMENLSDPAKLGAGIAVAFVATVYGVGLANLFFLPLGAKLKLRHLEDMVRFELVLEGVCAIAEGENPRLIERKLSVYVHERKAGASPDEAKAAAQSPEALSGT
jgi:chemotaxis protein MotA